MLSDVVERVVEVVVARRSRLGVFAAPENRDEKLCFEEKKAIPVPPPAVTAEVTASPSVPLPAAAAAVAAATDVERDEEEDCFFSVRRSMMAL